MSVALDDLITSWIRDLRGRQLSPRTVGTYREAMQRMRARLPEHCLTDAASIGRDDIRGYFAAIGETRKPGGVSVDWRAVQQFFKWADEAEEEITPNPMARMRPPVVPDPETPVLRPAQVKALLKACDGRDFMARRDLAIISLYLDTGIRREEMAGLDCDSVNIDLRECYVMGKGRRARVAPFGHQSARALDRYERVRRQHRQAQLQRWWLAERGREMTAWGIDQVVRRRGRQADLPGLHPHMLRHTWAHSMKGILPDDEIMRLAGWQSQQMLARYAASTADERARESAKRSAPLDRLR